MLSSPAAIACGPLPQRRAENLLGRCRWGGSNFACAAPMEPVEAIMPAVSAFQCRVVADDSLSAARD